MVTEGSVLDVRSRTILCFMMRDLLWKTCPKVRLNVRKRTFQKKERHCWCTLLITIDHSLPHSKILDTISAMKNL